MSIHTAHTMHPSTRPARRLQTVDIDELSDYRLGVASMADNIAPKRRESLQSPGLTRSRLHPSYAAAYPGPDCEEDRASLRNTP